jgi:hypothetical protein
VWAPAISAGDARLMRAEIGLVAAVREWASWPRWAKVWAGLVGRICLLLSFFFLYSSFPFLIQIQI